MRISYRTGRKEDVPSIARLVDLASDGFINFLFHDLVPDCTPVQLIEHGLGSENEPHTWENTIVAVEKDRVAGMALSYPSSYHHITPEMDNFIPPERLDHVRNYYQARVEGSWLLETLAVFPEFQNMGIGGELLVHTKKRALEKGYQTLSLIVYKDNVAAQRFYSRYGFVTVQDVDLEYHELIPHEGGCLLMKCDLLTVL